MSAKTAQADSENSAETTPAEAKNMLQQRFPGARFNVFETTGTIHVILGQENLGETNCCEVGAIDAPDGWEFETASLHVEGEMMATFEKVER